MGSLLDDGGEALTAIVLTVLGAVLLLGALAAFLMRGRGSEESPAGGRGRNPRLVVSEAATIDGRRRLVLVRRDNVEHLLLIGGPSDVVVESNVVRQRAPGVAPGQRPAVARQREPQATRPAAPAAPASALPERGRAGTDGAAQERLRTASTALAVRQAVAQPGEADAARSKGEATEAQSPGSTAVAGLAAGLAALTAAAGPRGRREAPEADKSDPERAGPVAGETGEQAQLIPDKPEQAAQAAPAGLPSQAAGPGEEPARAVFGLREAPQGPTASAGAPEQPAAGHAAQQTSVGPAGEKADDGSGAEEPATLNRRSIEAEFAFLDGGNADRTGTGETASDAQAAPAGPVSASAEGNGGPGTPAEGQSGPASAPSPTSNQDEPQTAATAPGAGAPEEPATAIEPHAASDTPSSEPPGEATTPADPAHATSPEGKHEGQDRSEPATATDAGATAAEAGSDDGDSHAAAAERSGPAEDQRPQIEAPTVRTGSQPAPPVRPAASMAEPTTRNNEPAAHSEPAAPRQSPGQVEEQYEPVQPGSAAAPGVAAEAAQLSGFRPSRGTTLGDLAERLEEVLIQKAASDPSSDGGAAITPSPAAPQRDEPSRAASSGWEHPEPQPDQRQPTATVELAVAADKDEAAIIDFTAHRKSNGDSLEEEMARLLGELTRDTSRR